MSKKKKDNAYYDAVFKLVDQISVTSEIMCSKCDKEDSIQADFDDAAEEWYDEGWRGTDNNVYCPKCAKKYRVK